MSYMTSTVKEGAYQVSQRPQNRARAYQHYEGTEALVPDTLTLLDGALEGFESTLFDTSSLCSMSDNCNLYRNTRTDKDEMRSPPTRVQITPKLKITQTS